MLVSLAPAQTSPPLPDRRDPDARRTESAIDSILAGLTPDEKIGQLIQYSGDWTTGPQGRALSTSQQDIVRAGMAGSLLNVFGSRATRELQRLAVEESRARIPLIFGLDVIHGFRTIFPIPLGEAASWDPGAVEKSARIAATEAASAGIGWTFGPMVDIARDPRWGRIAEGSGEDPYLGSAMAAARVRGFQGSSLSDHTSIVACAKHFAAYGGAEGGRDYNTVDISERTLRDVYLPPFKSAVEAGALTLMASFNEIGGVPSSANRQLLTGILRGEWGFDGFVVSDWGSIGELRAHGVASTSAEAARIALDAGLDMDMMSGCYRDNIASLLRDGRLRSSALDEAVRRILRVKFRLGLFADPYRGVNPEREKTVLLSSHHLAAAREVARKSIVLLKNERNLLPLRKDLRSIAVIGPLADDREDPLGPWAGDGKPKDVVTLLEGIKRALPATTRVIYAPGCMLAGTDTAGIAEAVAAARQAETVLLAVGESASMSGEAASRSELDLPGRQKELVRAVQATGTPVVLILMNGRPLTICWEAENVRAILETWFLGVQTGNAIADVVFGDYNPSGRLPVTFPRSVGQIPYYYNHKNTGRPPVDSVKYTSHYLDLPSSPLYPFGYGLSYTTFSYEGITLARPVLGTGDTLSAAISVSNRGTRGGEETVQLYIRDESGGGGVTRPVKELKAFRKVRLEPGETVTVGFSLPVSALAFSGLDMRPTVEPGTFRLFIGPNSAEGLESGFRVKEKTAR